MAADNISLLNTSAASNGDGDGGKETEVQNSLLLIVNLIVMTFICGGNLLTILAVWKTPALRTVPNMYIVSLAVADFLTGAIIPYYSFALFPDFKPEFDSNRYLCLFLFVFFHIFVAESILCMVTVAFDRYLFIRYPLHYTLLTSPRKAGAIIGISWVLSIFVGSVPLFVNNWTEESGCDSFEILTTSYRVYALVPAFFSCCFLTAGFYGYIVNTALRYQRNARKRRVSQANSLSSDGSKEWKSVKVFVVVFGVFFVCWCPNFTLVIIGHLGQSISREIVHVTVVLGFLNSGMNVIIYAWQYKQFRRSFKILLGRHRRSSSTTLPPSP